MSVVLAAGINADLKVRALLREQGGAPELGTALPTESEDPRSIGGTSTPPADGDEGRFVEGARTLSADLDELRPMERAPTAVEPPSPGLFAPPTLPEPRDGDEPDPGAEPDDLGPLAPRSPPLE